MGRNAFFNFKTFGVQFSKKVFPVGTDSSLLGAWMCFHYPKHKTSPTALDIGCGTGVLSLFAATEINAKVTAIDIQQTAIDQCFENAQSNALEDKISPILSEIQSFQPKTTFDLIVSNPPYFPDLKQVNTEREIARQAGTHFSANGLMTKVSELLTPTGSFYLVIPFDQKDIYQLAGIKNNLKIHHQALVKGKHAVEIKRVLLCFSKAEPQYIKEEIIILEEKRNLYTPKAYRLLKPYYLNL